MLLGVALAAPRDARLPRLDAPLRQAWARHEKGAPRLLPHALPELADGAGVRVTLELPARPGVARALATAGWTVLAHAELSDGTAWVLVDVPWADLPALESVPGLRRARLPHRASEKRSAADRGEVVSEGLEAIFRDGDWIEAGVHGRRVDVVVADVGFADAAALHGDELPANTRMSSSDGIDATGHGTAVTEVLNDLAPGVRVRLKHFTTGVEFLELMEDLAGERRAELVNGSIGFDNVWPADGTSPYTRAVDSLADAGALWVGAAGNEGGRYLAGALRADGDGVLLAGEGGAWVPIIDGVVEASLRWSEPMSGASVDLDLIASDTSGQRCGRADDPQDGGDSVPTETLVADCPGQQAWVEVVRADPSADLTGLTGWLYAPMGLSPAVVEPGLGVLTLPADTRAGLAVGACDRDTDAAPAYSSWGPTEDGRTKPDLCAPDGVSTATYGELNFFGTSASTPHATGMAALVAHGERLRRDPAALKEAVLAHTVDLGDPGADDVFGAGALDAGPPPEGCHCSSAGRRMPAIGLTLLGLVVAARRRRVRAPRPRESRSPDIHVARGMPRG
jgi:hypothetical protein